MKISVMNGWADSPSNWRNFFKLYARRYGPGIEVFALGFVFFIFWS